VKSAEVFRLYEAAMQLSEAERRQFVARLVEGMGKQPTQEEIDASWIAEAKRRWEEIRTGRMPTFSPEEVMREARAALERARGW
jgi:putative addiction module component (TIGR02574 family)